MQSDKFPVHSPTHMLLLVCDWIIIRGSSIDPSDDIRKAPKTITRDPVIHPIFTHGEIHIHERGKLEPVANVEMGHYKDNCPTDEELVIDLIQICNLTQSATCPCLLSETTAEVIDCRNDDYFLVILNSFVDVRC